VGLPAAYNSSLEVDVSSPPVCGVSNHKAVCVTISGTMNNNYMGGL
jgi:hypothetical protein